MKAETIVSLTIRDNNEMLLIATIENQVILNKKIEKDNENLTFGKGGIAIPQKLNPVEKLLFFRKVVSEISDYLNKNALDKYEREAIIEAILYQEYFMIEELIRNFPKLRMNKIYDNIIEAKVDNAEAKEAFQEFINHWGVGEIKQSEVLLVKNGIEQSKRLYLFI